MIVEHHKPHPDAVLVMRSTGDVRAYPTGRARDVSEDVADARFAGYCVAVPIIKTASGTRRHVSIDDTAGGVLGLDKALRQKRMVRGKQYPVNMLASDYARLSDAEKAAMLDAPATPKIDPRDVELADLRAKLAGQQAPKSKAAVTP
jgi:hypothetical protein